eukprot:TRINITY_DN2967_c0_g1_i2.p1 TRINITY_DN2967_c0_g1~~TRINITY_DN2967_c0_g1_i2.p1  ORF type:complete len:705 (-),score=158.25 TRINITY_DN2967_c0_g1_i2:103-1998(-)
MALHMNGSASNVPQWRPSEAQCASNAAGVLLLNVTGADDTVVSLQHLLLRGCDGALAGIRSVTPSASATASGMAAGNANTTGGGGGKGAGAQYSACFHVSAAVVEVDSVEAVRCNSSIVAASVHVRASSFVQAQSTSPSAALKVDASVATVTDCSFMNNTGGAALDVRSAVRCNVTRSTFEGNEGAGALELHVTLDSPEVHLSSVRLVRNAGRQPAVLVLAPVLGDGSVSLYQCEFMANTAESNGYGSALHVSSALTVSMDQCEVSNNTLGVLGILNIPTVNVGFGHITHSLFSNNNATALNCFYGCEVSDSVFRNNSAWSDGGAINSGSPLNVTRCSFTQNVVPGDGGAIRDSSRSSAVTDCTFEYNRAKQGGAIAGFRSNDITRCSFSHNEAQFGGAVALDYEGGWSPSVIRASSFYSNVATDKGGSLLVGDVLDMTAAKGGHHVYVDECVFSNSSASSGGAIHLTAATLTLDGCLVDGGSTSVSSGLYALECAYSRWIYGDEHKPVLEANNTVFRNALVDTNVCNGVLQSNCSWSELSDCESDDVEACLQCPYGNCEIDTNHGCKCMNVDKYCYGDGSSSGLDPLLIGLFCAAGAVVAVTGVACTALGVWYMQRQRKAGYESINDTSH